MSGTSEDQRVSLESRLSERDAAILAAIEKLLVGKTGEALVILEGTSLAAAHLSARMQWRQTAARRGGQ